jgi:hypothetical protein
MTEDDLGNDGGVAGITKDKNLGINFISIILVI